MALRTLAVVLLAPLVLAGPEPCALTDSLELDSAPAGLHLDKNNCNTTFSKTEWQQQPKVKYENADPEKKYAVFLVDPDAVNIKEGQYYWHWFASNIPGSELKTGDWTQDYSMLKYMGPGPPKGTGLHRYQFLLYEFERPQETMNVLLTQQDRTPFELEPFLASLKDQSPLKGPVAGAQFLSQF